MTTGPSRLGICILIAGTFLLQTAAAQRTAPPSPGRGSTTSRTPTSPDTTTQPVFVAGRVILDGGAPLPEPVAIERICSGVSRREGYTDFKGQFQIQLGTNLGFQDASENDPRTTPGSPARTTAQSGNRRPPDLSACEFRAVLAGFQSSTVSIRTSGDMFQFDVGTIVLKRMGEGRGATVSLTTMSAPKDARQAFEKALRAMQENRLEVEEKELEKAVRLYPQFAAAWSMLGDLHHQRNQIEEARTAYKQALAADPQYVNPSFGLALIAIQEKNWEEAARLTALVAAMNSYAYPAAYFYNAAANYNLAKYEPAEESARKYKTLDTEHKHPDVALLLSNLLLQKNDYAGAAQQIRDYLALVPNAPNAEELKARTKSLEDLSLAKKQ
ncbi:MAG TPA: tetratricopeptide repeat protein [Candidatus Angelobacter sp.]